jgi:hypothetical protein
MMVLLLIVTLTAFQKRPHLLLFHLMFSPILLRTGLTCLQGQEAMDNEVEAIARNERDLEEEEHLPEVGGASNLSDSESKERDGGQV